MSTIFGRSLPLRAGPWFRGVKRGVQVRGRKELFGPDRLVFPELSDQDEISVMEQYLPLLREYILTFSSLFYSKLFFSFYYIHLKKYLPGPVKLPL